MSGVAAARDAVSAATESLAAAGCATPRLDAEVLVATAMGVPRLALLGGTDLELDPEASRRVMEWVRRRARREPVAYIIGRKEFRRLELEVESSVLIPRPETELLVEVAAELADLGARVHDVGTGSGAVALALADERPGLRVTASDRSPAAVEVARRNARRLGLPVEITCAAGLPEGEYDMVVANLPYVREDEWDGLAPEIREYEPRDALVAGADGLDEIRALVSEAPAGTTLALEHAPDQAEDVRGLLADAETREDLSKLARVTVGRVP
jgi:release factor glutamine methyltransferase